MKTRQYSSLMIRGFILIICIAFISCAHEEEVFELPDGATKMLTNDSSKVWKLARRFNNGTRMNMGDCFLAHRHIFNARSTFRTSASGRSDCGEPMVGNWVFAKDKLGNSYIRLESDQIPEMLNITDSFKLFKIQNLTDSLLVLQFTHAQTTKRKTTMVDYYVPENIKVEDRDFHW